VRKILGFAILLACPWSFLGCQASLLDLTGLQDQPSTAPAPPQTPSGLFIDTDSNLPDTFPHAPYQFRFHARSQGSQHWRLLKGALPPGMKLEDDGFLHGQAERIGEFQFTLAVWEADSRDEAVQKGFTLRVHSALMLDWKNYAQVKGSRIEGSAAVTNTTPDDVDLTFIVMALPPNGRAVAIGYQHFVLKRGTAEMELPFGDSLPHGGYVVRVDAVGEVAAKKLIYREYLQTPGPLHVNVGP
jgi:hypothetical protein